LDWFNTLYFRPQNGLLPELIDKTGSRISIKEIVKKHTLMDVLKQSSLQHETRPYILYNGTHNIYYLDKLFITQKHKKILQEQEVAFYFFEPLTHYLSPLCDRNLPSHILKIEDNSPEVVKRIRCLELDSISAWVNQHNIKNLIVYCTDFNCQQHYQKIYPNIKLLTLDLFVNWYCIRKNNFNEIVNLDSNKIKKKFWCGAWRYDASRHFITAYLASQNLTLNNNVSFFFKISNAEFKRRMWFGWHEFEFRHNGLSKKLIDGNTLLQNQVPLSIDINEPLILGENHSDPEADGNGKNVRKDHNPINSYYESFCAIVLESRTTQPWPNISEKTLNAIDNYRPFILAGTAGTLKMLKELGFKTFDQWWDESYDNITNNTDRFAAICKLIDYVNSFSVEELKSMHQDMQSVLTHNRENLKKVPKFYNKINKRLNKKISK
jgi:hypothetical protein